MTIRRLVPVSGAPLTQAMHSLYEIQRLETLVVRITIACGVHAQAEILKLQSGRGRGASRESSPREESP
jgi:hypothetical protein